MKGSGSSAAIPDRSAHSGSRRGHSRSTVSHQGRKQVYLCSHGPLHLAAGCIGHSRPGHYGSKGTGGAILYPFRYAERVILGLGPEL